MAEPEWDKWQDGDVLEHSTGTGALLRVNGFMVEPFDGGSWPYDSPKRSVEDATGCRKVYDKRTDTWRD